MLTFWEYRRKAHDRVWTHRERPGQAAYNVLVDVRPDLSNLIVGTDLDPFYTEQRLYDFYKFVSENW